MMKKKLHFQDGLSMVELMVAMVLGLMGTVVIFTVYLSSDSFKRSSVALGDAQSNGATGMFFLERYIRTAGSGIATSNESYSKEPGFVVAPNLLLGCRLAGSFGSVVTTPATALFTPVAPVRIIDGSVNGAGADGSDVVVVMGGTSTLATNPTAGSGIAAASTSASISNLLGWTASGATGNIGLFVLDAFPPPASVPNPTLANGIVRANISTQRCFMRRVTAVSGVFGSGNLTLNAAPPVAGNYSTGAVNSHNVGPTPMFLSIGVNASQQLVETNFTQMVTGEAAVPTTRVIAEGVVSLQAQYGIDNDQDDNIDAWVEPIGNWANPHAADLPSALPAPAPAAGSSAITRIKAIRFAIITRSTHYATPAKGTTTCEVTPTRVAWNLLEAVPGQIMPIVVPAMPVGVDVLGIVKSSAPSTAVGADWRCFRYRTFESIVPVVNMQRSPL